MNTFSSFSWNQKFSSRADILSRNQHCKTKQFQGTKKYFHVLHSSLRCRAGFLIINRQLLLSFTASLIYFEYVWFIIRRINDEYCFFLSLCLAVLLCGVFFSSQFLVACTRLCDPLCPSVGWSVSRSVRHAQLFLSFYVYLSHLKLF